ncbi:putative DNA-3-methyladenine glycosylase 2 isoform X4 [Prunus yedoensis var. nudiflora]|uniref:Putative DNA-3-methyladenine glycosylase 2 isoform X4 n=1 Tax=Prunus yedoensis var. nudiflora TaxID=2094558 RepID=A0A314YC11_PRUYE|nr:putative DNA-3-methyladenine glycosylase 2 isoform X4 [Prunus yedoensis var. nudiflora]
MLPPNLIAPFQNPLPPPKDPQVIARHLRPQFLPTNRRLTRQPQTPSRRRQVRQVQGPRPLSCEGEVEAAIRHLRNADPLLAPLIDLHQRPTFDTFQTPFLALTRSILYQQLAYKAGNSIYTRFVGLCGGEACVVPETVLAQTPQQLRQIGVSGRKASYLHDLARKYQNGILSDAAIVNMDDKSLFTMLTMVNGIGSWSVHMFMIFSLHRPDVLPINDLSMRKGVQLLYNLDELPRPSQMEHLCEKWRPYRSVAACYMWRFSESKGAPSSAAAVAAEWHFKCPLNVILLIESWLEQVQEWFLCGNLAAKSSGMQAFKDETVLNPIQ